MRVTARVVVVTATLTTMAVGVAARAGGGGRPPSLRTAVPTMGVVSAQARSIISRVVAATLSHPATFSMTLTGATMFGSAAPVTAMGWFDFSALRGVTSIALANATPQERAIYDPSAVYTRLGIGSLSLPPGKSWLVAYFSNAEEIGRNFPAFFAQVESLNPGLTLTELALGTTSAIPAGRETTSGLHATRYVVTVDLRGALAGVWAAGQMPYALALQSQLAGLGRADSGPPTPPASPVVVMSVWTTDDGQLTRIDVSPPVPGIAAISMTLGRYTATGSADPPPAAQVIDLDLLSPRGERESRNGGDSDGA